VAACVAAEAIHDGLRYPFRQSGKGDLRSTRGRNGLIPGGGALDRLPLLVGRSRALEIILGADDYDADNAERYGWINRADTPMLNLTGSCELCPPRAFLRQAGLEHCQGSDQHARAWPIRLN